MKIIYVLILFSECVRDGIVGAFMYMKTSTAFWMY